MQLAPGTYVVAVSGGVDSMALLHYLRQLQAQEPKNWRFTVAHFDHGIRDDSMHDRRLVQATAKAYGMPFVYDQVKLGDQTSEATARQARYEFLRGVRRATGARSIITAHHQDDVLETAIFNLSRGTGRRGLTAMLNNPEIHRPLTHLTKAELIDYAESNGLVWRDDRTNQDESYKRNYIRQKIMPRVDAESRQTLLEIIAHLNEVNAELDGLLVNALHMQPQSGTMDRHFFNLLPHAVAREAMASLLRHNGITEYDRPLLERLVVSAKVAQSGRVFPIRKGWYLAVQPKLLALVPPER